MEAAIGSDADAAVDAEAEAEAGVAILSDTPAQRTEPPRR